MIAPHLVTKYGYQAAFFCCGTMCISCVLAAIAETLYIHHLHRSFNYTKISESDQHKDSRQHEAAPLAQKEWKTATVHTADLMSEELTAIESMLDEALSEAASDNFTPGDAFIDDEFVMDILDNTQYSKLTAKQREEENFPTINKTLSFATHNIVGKMEEADVSTQIYLVPFSVRVSLTLMSSLYMGMYYAFGGWISSYALIRGSTSSSDDASSLTATYYLLTAVGSVISVPCAVWISTSTMLRFQLVVVLCGSVILGLLANDSFLFLSVATAIMGVGNSCMFPLILTMVNDYGYSM